MLNAEKCWRLLRASRAEPPGLVTTGARRRLYGAALEQAEQLWRAGIQVGEAVSPILLYYALTQGTQAVLASRVEGNGWRPTPSHGLRPGPVDLPEDATAQLDDFSVHDEGNGYFQQVANLLRSPTLPTRASLAALASSLPDSPSLLRRSNAYPSPLHVAADEGLEVIDWMKAGRVSAWVSPLPDELVPESPILNPSDPEYLPSLEQVVEWLKPYKRFTGEGAPSAVLQINKASHVFGDTVNAVRLAWDDPAANSTDWAGRSARIRQLIDHPEDGLWGHRPNGEAIPVVGENDQALHPMVSWWAILYSMSMIARYQPNRWARLLNLDASPDAERAREVLQQFSRVMPWLVLAEVFAAS